jgi:hypothetical protein
LNADESLLRWSWLCLFFFFSCDGRRRGQTCSEEGGGVGCGVHHSFVHPSVPRCPRCAGFPATARCPPSVGGLRGTCWMRRAGQGRCRSAPQSVTLAVRIGLHHGCHELSGAAQPESQGGAPSSWPRALLRGVPSRRRVASARRCPTQLTCVRRPTCGVRSARQQRVTARR